MKKYISRLRVHDESGAVSLECIVLHILIVAAIVGMVCVFSRTIPSIIDTWKKDKTESTEVQTKPSSDTNSNSVGSDDKVLNKDVTP